MVKDEMILIETLKAIEPALKKYFAYDRAMLYKEIESMYLAIHPEGLYGVLNDDKYMIEVPNTLDELATSDNPFDYLRYAPREQKMIKAFDSLAYMTDNIQGILFKDDGVKKKIEELVERSNIPEEYQVAMVHVLWILAIIYKKHEAFQPILDPELLDATCNMDTYFKQIRPEMLQLYLFLKGDRRKKNKSITLSNNQEKITINNATENWFTNLLDSYLHIYLGVDSVEEAIAHINKYNTKHSEAIITNDYTHAQKFLDEVDAAAVYVNASTRFTDGNEFGFGAEIGISTQKLHARGPMGLLALTTTKYIIYGNGQVRP